MKAGAKKRALDKTGYSRICTPLVKNRSAAPDGKGKIHDFRPASSPYKGVYLLVWDVLGRTAVTGTIFDEFSSSWAQNAKKTLINIIFVKYLLAFEIICTFRRG